MKRHSIQLAVHPLVPSGGTTARVNAKPVFPWRTSAGAPLIKRKWTTTIVRTISAKALTVFTRQLARLVRAGLPLLRALEVLERQEQNATFQAVLVRLSETIRSGGSFSDGLRRHPKVFDRLYVNMVSAGEVGGVLALVLERHTVFTEKTGRIKGRIGSAMTYPVIIIIVAVAIVAALMVLVVPKFQGIFLGVLKGQSMPALTQAVIDVSNFARSAPADGRRPPVWTLRGVPPVPADPSRRTKHRLAAAPCATVERSFPESRCRPVCADLRHAACERCAHPNHPGDCARYRRQPACRRRHQCRA
ncbi:MAG: hypothetical protein EXS39_07845 [Opitutaceae bacterium]|nr:hypothetical protein [Opitutaceae bacterium]